MDRLATLTELLRHWLCTQQLRGMCIVHNSKWIWMTKYAVVPCILVLIKSFCGSFMMPMQSIIIICVLPITAYSIGRISAFSVILKLSVTCFLIPSYSHSMMYILFHCYPYILYCHWFRQSSGASFLLQCKWRNMNDIKCVYGWFIWVEKLLWC